MNQIIGDIIDIEWEMFDKVKNVSGRASCQDNKGTFIIMRQSQFEAWNDEMLMCYLQDLQNAMTSGRNLLTEKYAYMMEYTVPDEFEKIKDRLPEITAERLDLAKEITRQHLEWYGEVQRKYPLATGSGRLLYSKDESPEKVSIETYTMGELCTYSINTLRAYAAYISRLIAANQNMALMITENTAKLYGYASLDEIEQNRRQ